MGILGVWLKRLFGIGVVVVIAIALLASLMPQPARVDLVKVERAKMEVAIRDDGQTRVKERYIVSAPIAGEMRRVELEVGDEVKEGETVIARIVPVVPAFLDARARARAEALVKAAEGRLSRAQADLRRAGDELEQAKIDLDRFKQLRLSGASTDAQLEQAQLTFRKYTEALKSAEFQEDVARFELQQEQTSLLQITGELGNQGNPSGFEIRSPVNGRVLKLMQESSCVMSVGMPILEVGNPHELEVIADILSNDAVKMKPGQTTRFVHWGGSRPLQGVVKLVEPSGFTKISALGVEEQRVNVIFDLLGSTSDYPMLGDGFRVEVEVVVWESESTLQVPTAALFRTGSDWAVFLVKDKKAVLQKVEIGENNGLSAQVLEGLEEGALVISHPGDDVQDGVSIIQRNAGT